MLGAEVIKVEPLDGVDTRRMGPFAPSGESLVHAAYDRGKASVALDLDSPSGRKDLLALIEGADCVLDSLGPGAFEALGLPFEELLAEYPHLVVGTVTAFGHSGPKAQWPVSDITLMASGCTMAFTGDADRSPLRVSVPQAFHFGAAVLAGGVIAALIERGRSGSGQLVDVAAQQVVPPAVLMPLFCRQEVAAGAMRTVCQRGITRDDVGAIKSCGVHVVRSAQPLPMKFGSTSTAPHGYAGGRKIAIWHHTAATFYAASGKDGTTPGYAWDYQIDTLGYKYYMIDIIAALGLSQMKKLDGFLKTRRHIQERYNNELSDTFERPPYSDTVQYYSTRLDEKVYTSGNSTDTIGRNELVDYLSDKKIHTSVHFKPLHQYSLLQQDREYPVADTEWKRLITLPCFNNMTDDDISYVVYWVNKFIDDEYTNV